MQKHPLKLINSLERRKENQAFRKLPILRNLIDFSSNDYLGFAACEEIFNESQEILEKYKLKKNGSSGSRLLSGNNEVFEKTETFLAEFHETEAALIFNSGYDANLGVFGSIPQRGDVILYDELVHASIRDAISLSHAKALKFKHNNLEHLKEVLQKYSGNSNTEVYIATESVFSMDGDLAPLQEIADLAENFNAFLIVDEAHATGIFGKKGEGLVQKLHLEHQVFARINTFGKGIGAHGAVVLGSQNLKEFLINFARSFIYTTALSPHSVATIFAAYKKLENGASEINKLWENIDFFRKEVKKNKLEKDFIESNSAIHCCIIPGNQKVKEVALELEKSGFDVKPILSPTVPLGKERLRFCVHSFNSEEEITKLLKILAKAIR